MKVEILTEDQAIQDQAFLIEVKVYEAGAQLVPTSATITIKDPDGTVVVSAAAMTVEAGVGTLTYSLAAASTADLWENATITIAYVISTVTYTAMFFFDVVLTALKANVIDADLKRYFPQIVSDIWAEEVNYDGQIQEAFRLVKRLIKDRGRRPAMLIDGSQVRELVIIKTFEIIFFNFSKTPDDIWWRRYEQYKEVFQQRFDALVIKYDEDESGTIDDSEAGGSLGQITLSR